MASDKIDKILSEEAGICVIENLTKCIDKLENGIKDCGHLVADVKSLNEDARLYFDKQQKQLKRQVEEVKALIKKIRHEEV